MPLTSIEISANCSNILIKYHDLHCCDPSQCNSIGSITITTTPVYGCVRTDSSGGCIEEGYIGCITLIEHYMNCKLCWPTRPGFNKDEDGLINEKHLEFFRKKEKIYWPAKMEEKFRLS